MIKGETQGTKFVPPKWTELYDNLPSWAPNWTRGNKLIKAGANVLDIFPSTEPRAMKSFDRKGRQVGMTYSVNMGKDNHNGRYRNWQFPVIPIRSFPSAQSLGVDLSIQNYIQNYGGKRRYVLEITRKYTCYIWPRRNMRHWSVEIVLMSLKRAPNFLAVRR